MSEFSLKTVSIKLCKYFHTEKSRTIFFQIKNFLIFIIIFILIYFYYKYKQNDSNYKNHIIKRIDKDFYTIKYGKSFESNSVSIISMYFALNKSKHSIKEYNKWIRNFFSSVTAPLILFTNYKSINDDLLKLRFNLTTLIYVYNDSWNILKEIEIKRNMKYTYNYKNIQNNIDPERFIHTSDLYLLWNIKSYITNKVAQENVFNSSMFLYTDAGAWRSKPFYNWPNISFVKQISSVLNDKILFGQIEETYLKDNYNFPLVDLIEGTFFMGSQKAISLFENNFWRLHDERFKQGLFIGKDQTIMNLLAFNSSMKSIRLRTWNLKCLNQLDPWFFYQYYFAANKYYFCKEPKEKLLIQD